MSQTSRKAGARSAAALASNDKAAALLLSMDKGLAGRLIKHFDDSEVRLLAETAARLGSLPQQSIEEAIEEFTAAFAEGSDLQGSPGAAEKLLDGIVDSKRLSSMMSEIAGNASSRVWKSLATVSETTLAQYLSKQHPQVIAFVLSRLQSGLAALVLDQLSAPQRVEAMRRMLVLKEISPTPLQILEENLQAELVRKSARSAQADVHAQIAAVLNKMARETADATFSGLNALRPKDAAKIKGLLFTFNDIAKLSEESRAKLFEGVPVEVTIASLHGASADLQQLILMVQSQRSKRMIETEMQNGKTPNKAEISKAQRAISERALELVESGVIEIGAES